MVDHMVSAVGRHMLLDSDLGNMVNLVVNLNSNLVNNGCSGNNRGSVHKRGSVYNWGSMDNWGSMNNWGGNSKRCSMGNSNRGSSSNSRSRGIDTSYKTMSKKTMSKETMSQKTTSNKLSICISCRGSKTTGNEGRENNKKFHVWSCE